MDFSELPTEIRSIWNNANTPIVIRTNQKGAKLSARLPYRDNNRSWVNSIGKSRATYNGNLKVWEMPKIWLNPFINESLNRYGSIYVVQPHNALEVCAPACRNATGHECQCSCLGENHGTGGGNGWFDVSDTLAFRWATASWAIRKLTMKNC